MRFAAVFREFLRVPPAAVASAADLGTWVRLYVCAAEIEKGGRLQGAVEWTDRQWLAFAQVTRTEVAGAIAAGLITTDGKDLIVVGYDLQGEARVRAQREAGREHGAKPPGEGKRPRGRPKKGDEKGGENGEKTDGETEGKGHENADKRASKPEGKGKKTPSSDPISISDPIPITSASAPSERGDRGGSEKELLEIAEHFPRSVELQQKDPGAWRNKVELIPGHQKLSRRQQHEALETILLAGRAAS